jgi:hypothetical protein
MSLVRQAPTANHTRSRSGKGQNREPRSTNTSFCLTVLSSHSFGCERCIRRASAGTPSQRVIARRHRCSIASVEVLRARPLRIELDHVSIRFAPERGVDALCHRIGRSQPRDSLALPPQV